MGKSRPPTDGQRYPWGTDTARIQFVNAHDEIGNTTPVGAFPLGTSYYGALDMGGNVREWVSDWYDAQYYSHTPLTNPQGPLTGEKKVLKGAAFINPGYTAAPPAAFPRTSITWCSARFSLCVPLST